MNEPAAPSRRSILQKGAAGATLVWAAPVLTTIPAAAQQGSPAPAPGDFLFTFGTAGAGDGQFDGPGGVAVDTTGRIHVADTINHRIQVFDNTGAHQLTVGTAGAANGQFNSPYGVAVDTAGRIHVADTNNNRIQVFLGF
jgi:DNA-binding beta-propeller fold protein YncE